MIRVLIADDHPMVREGLKKILKEEPDIQVVCEAIDGKQILEQVEEYKLNVAVIDLSMPRMNGLEVLKELRQKRPALPVLVLSMHPEERFALRVLRAGAAGYLTKESAPEDLVKAIRKAVQGGKYITPTLAEKLAYDLEAKSMNPVHEALSDRELQVMCMIASGKKVRKISQELFLSINTVNTYRTRILEKMNMKSDTELTYYAMQNRLID